MRIGGGRERGGLGTTGQGGAGEQEERERERERRGAFTLSLYIICCHGSIFFFCNTFQNG